MRAGRLDRRIDIQRRTVVTSTSGEPVETWATLALRAASVGPVNGDERFSEPEMVAKQQTEFQIRWSDSVADLSPLDRIIYPVPVDTSPPTLIADTSIYDILAVHEIGRREGFKIIAVRRTDI